MKKILGILLYALFLVPACSQSNTASTPSATAFLLPTAMATQVFPTPSSQGDSIIWENLRVTMAQLEITQEYLNDFGSTRSPSAGQKFLWVHVQLKNLGPVGLEVPIAEHFSILYAARELKPTYGHRQGYPEYTALGAAIFPDQELDGWLRFDIPVAAELSDLHLVFIPESSQVGASFSSPNYPYAEDKPTYVWNCAP
jgi:hypothetical protein